MICGFAAMFGAAAPAGAATDSFALSSAAVSGQSSVTWQGPPVNPPATPNAFPDATSPITLTGQIDPSTGAITDGALTLPGIPQPVQEGEATTFTFSEVHPGTATGTYNGSTGAVSLSDTFTLTFVGTGTIGITCVSTPIPMTLAGTYDSATQDITLSTATSFTIPQFPASSGNNCDLANGSLNVSPGGVAGAVGNAMSVALHGQFSPGLPTTTTLAVSPDSPQLAGTAVTLNATVALTSGSGTPTGTVAFFDNGASLGTSPLSGSDTASLTTSSLPAGANQKLTAAYSGDTTYGGSTSSPSSYTITPLPTVGADLPTTMTVPSASEQPTVTSLSPDAGSTSGGTQVTITGTGFLPKSTVHFGSKAAANVTFNSSTELTATSPAGTGTVDVTVTTSAGTSSASFGDTFAYGAPTVTAVTGSAGPINTSFEVIITGSGFTPSATVNFGSTAAASVAVDSPTSLRAITPTAPAGTVDVTVTTNGGTSATSDADHYTYSQAPAVASLGTQAGPAAGGTSVVIAGDSSTGATAVNFGSTPATSFTVNAAGTSITAVSPAGTSGSVVDVTVTTPNGTSAKWLYDQFTYGPPTVTGLSPSGGPAAGGTTVTVTGTGFAPSLKAANPTVKFGTKKGTSVKVTSPTSLTATAPAGTGAVDVVVTTSGGTSATSPADQFTYGPAVTGVSPASGPTAGGTSVSVVGSGFTGATAVSFGSTAASSFTVNSATSITATAPAGSTGTVDITVTTPAGTSPTSSTDQFIYGSPSVSAVAPNAGPTGGGTEVTISGAGFAGVSGVSFGATPAASYSVVSPIQITAVAPAGAGTVHITVTTNGGSSSASGAANEYTYNGAPSVASLTPATGSQGTGVTISGANFTAANGVYFGSTPASAFTVVNDSTITATAPAGSGAVDVTVTSSNGTSATGPNDVFAYGPPTVTNIAPSAGATAGGTSVVITGTGFVAGSTVDFGATSAAGVTIVSSTEITAVSPAESAGAVDITVSNAAGTSGTSGADVFSYSAGGDPGQAALTITNPSAGQSWNNLYLKIVLAGISSQPASNMSLSYQDTSGGWCPLTLSGTSTITTYFSGVGSSCVAAPGSFSLAPGATLTVPIQLTYNSGTYLGAQSVTATLYSGSCSSPTACSQSGSLNGSVVGSSTIQLTPPARLAATVKDEYNASPFSVRQSFQVISDSCVSAAVQATGTPSPTGTVEYLVDGNPVDLTTDGSTPTPNPTSLSGGCTGGATTIGYLYFNTSGLSVGTHTFVSMYSGDSVFAPATLTETFTVLPAASGTPYSCNLNAAGIFVMNGTGYMTTTSSAPSATPSGSSATVNDASVSVNLDPAVLSFVSGALNPGEPTTFSLSPEGSMGSSSNETFTPSAIDDILAWSGMSAAVPVTGDAGSTMAVGVGSLDYVDATALGSITFTCTPVSDDAQLASIPVAGNTLTASPSGSAAPGAPVTLTDTVAPVPSSNPGSVTFYDGSTVLGSSPVDPTAGTATFTTNQLAVGDHQLSAQWSGTLSIPANTSNTVDYQVGSSSTTTLVSSANPANAANPVTFTATVNGSAGGPQPTGDVSFSADGTTPAACQDVALSTTSPPTGTCKLSFKAGTTHSVVATYSGDATYLSSSSDPLSQSMLPGTTSTLTTAKNPAPAGNVTFWDGVSATGGGAVPTGTVAFTVDNKASAACAHQPLGSGGGASCTLSFKAGTTHTVSATYAGSSSYSGSKSNTITLKVSGASSSTKPKVTTASATLGSGKTLTAGQSIATGSYKLTMQADGNLVEYQGNKALWASGTSGHSGTKVTMQKDGNLVEYQGSKAIWASGTSGHAGAHLTLQGSDGNVVIYQGTTALWATGT